MGRGSESQVCWPWRTFCSPTSETYCCHFVPAAQGCSLSVIIPAAILQHRRAWSCSWEGTRQHLHLWMRYLLLVLGSLIIVGTWILAMCFPSWELTLIAWVFTYGVQSHFCCSTMGGSVSLTEQAFVKENTTSTTCTHWHLFFFFFCGTGTWTQGLHLETLHQPYFWDRVLQTICPGWLQTSTHLISASWVARIMACFYLTMPKCKIVEVRYKQ
jgi:hypothetical protein